MKAYTDLTQSKKLAEILPIDSADMGWDVFVDNSVRCLPMNDWDLHKDGSNGVKFIPCWSLAALIELMPKQLGRYTLTFYWCDDSWCCSYIDDGSEIKGTSSANNPVDATVEMIIKLKEKDLL